MRLRMKYDELTAGRKAVAWKERKALVKREGCCVERTTEGDGGAGADGAKSGDPQVPHLVPQLRPRVREGRSRHWVPAPSQITKWARYDGNCCAWTSCSRW